MHSSFGYILHFPGRVAVTRATKSALFIPSSTADTNHDNIIFHHGQSKTIQYQSNNQNNENQSIQEKIDSFLDAPFFDPDAIIENSNNNNNNKSNDDKREGNNLDEEPSIITNPILWFAKLVKNDYETAEALYAALISSVLVILTQEALRYVKYGDQYVPFTKLHESLF